MQPHPCSAALVAPFAERRLRLRRLTIALAILVVGVLATFGLFSRASFSSAARRRSPRRPPSGAADREPTRAARFDAIGFAPRS
jgi:hypothetical protein